MKGEAVYLVAHAGEEVLYLFIPALIVLAVHAARDRRSRRVGSDEQTGPCLYCGTELRRGVERCTTCGFRARRGTIGAERRPARPGG